MRREGSASQRLPEHRVTDPRSNPLLVVRTDGPLSMASLALLEALTPIGSFWTEHFVSLVIQRCLINAPVCSSAIAWRNSSWVFITIGPYQATGSSIGLPDTSRKRMPSPPA
jgi:hypothetical protein